MHELALEIKAWPPSVGRGWSEVLGLWHRLEEVLPVLDGSTWWFLALELEELLEDKLDGYVRMLGKEQSFNLHQYKNLQPQQAEVAKDMHKLARLLEALLAVSPTGQIKYAALKQALGCLSQKFGSDLLAAHFEGEKSLLAGRAADSIQCFSSIGGELLLLHNLGRNSKTSWMRPKQR
eukprot:s1496_g4.t1